MYPVLRNFSRTVRRFKMAAILNVLGLSVAFASFMIIMIQVDFDRSFDRFHADADRIFRVEAAFTKSVQAVFCRPLADMFFESSPAIVAGAVSNPWSMETFLSTETASGERHSFEELTISVSPSFTDVFAFDFTEGDPEALRKPETVIIPQSMARRIFGDEPAIGKQLTGEGNTLTVGGIYRDFPPNSILQNVLYYPIPENENKNNWDNWNYCTYIRVNNVLAASGLWENFKNNFDAKEVFGDTFSYEKTGFNLRLTALPDVHYVTGVQYDVTPKAARNSLAILTAIALVIVMIAGINFTNFSTAIIPMRVKSINTQKVLGARVRTLRMAITFEAVITCAVSFLMALLLMGIFESTQLAAYVDGDIHPKAHPAIVSGTALLAVLVGVLAGIYPARYITSFAPALVLKGSFGLSPKGRRLRGTLIGIQFVASMALITGAAFMFLQNRYMQRSPMGYDKDALLTVDIRHAGNRHDAIAADLRAFAGIENVTFAEQVLSSSDQYMGWERSYRGKNINFQTIPVHYTFLDVMKIDITDGRGFRHEDAATENGAFVFNETARRQYELELNTSFDDSGEIIGFMPDVKFASFRTAVDPMAFYVWGTSNWGTQPNSMYVRVKAGANMRAAADHIRRTLAGINPDYPFDVRFYDDVLQRLYEKEVALSTLIALFSIIAILIAIVGVFGLVVFDSECHRREIGIRKVLGASTWGIIGMFNRSYLVILAICFAVAAPVAWYVVNRWLENFAYKTPMHWWVYALAFAVVAVITSATITFQNWRVASDNPVKTINIE